MNGKQTKQVPVPLPRASRNFPDVKTRFFLQLIIGDNPIYSRVHISSDEVFSKILKKQSIVLKKMIPHMKVFSLFNKMKQKNFFF